jgi:hypothetical protein
VSRASEHTRSDLNPSLADQLELLPDEGVDGVLDAALPSLLLGLLSLFALASPPAGLLSPPVLFLALPYPSAYQPPPLSTNLLPEIRRCALGAPHFGQSVSAGSVMRCSASQAFPQSWQAYS